MSGIRVVSGSDDADVHGAARPVTVGRAKIERRPLICVRAAVPRDAVSESLRRALDAQAAAAARVTPDGERVASEPADCVYVDALLQNDWHVRVMGSDGKVRHSALLRPGDEILAHIEAPGRHTGLKVSEHIVER